MVKRRFQQDLACDGLPCGPPLVHGSSMRGRLRGHRAGEAVHGRTVVPVGHRGDGRGMGRAGGFRSQPGAGVPSNHQWIARAR